MLTSNQLLEKVKTKSQLTQGQAGLSDNQILSLASAQLQTHITRFITELSEDYMLYRESILLIPGKSTYRLPSRAFGSSLQHLFLSQNNQRTKMVKYNIDSLESFSGETSNPVKFLMFGNSIQILPDFSTNAPDNMYIELYYVYRPNRLVQEADCRKILSSTTNSITLPSVPPSFKSTNLYDIVSHEDGNELLHKDLVVDNITGNTITFTTDINVTKNNWLCIAETAPVPMIPSAYHELLVEFTVLEIHNARANTQGIEAQQLVITAMMKSMEEIYGQRVKSKPDIIVAKNPFLGY